MADTRTSEKDPSTTPIYTVRDFEGMQPNVDPHDVGKGKSTHQVNCGAGPSGELRVRLGAKAVRFG